MSSQRTIVPSAPVATTATGSAPSQPPASRAAPPVTWSKGSCCIAAFPPLAGGRRLQYAGADGGPHRPASGSGPGRVRSRVRTGGRAGKGRTASGAGAGTGAGAVRSGQRPGMRSDSAPPPSCSKRCWTLAAKAWDSAPP
ncbi:hypothetical protein GCM10010510_48500 [Streptomyces anandii JCM 4720]|nr:hypothetical protein GCM10010510_48500 [Streptomyces anandii JCM 4720]